MRKPMTWAARLCRPLPALALLALILPLPGRAEPAKALFHKNCASCHGKNRLGGMGPALLPENLHRLRRKAAFGVVKNGRPATQMQGFKGKLTDAQIQSLVDYVYTPLAHVPEWGMKEIKASHIQYHKLKELPNRPVFKADPQNLFIVVELGDHHATVLDGDKFEPIFRFKTRYALHGGPKYSPDGRFVYMCSRDGWISKFDIYNLKMVAEIRAGINSRNLAVSDDGRYVMVANYLPHTLVLLDARDLTPLKVLPVRDADGKSSRVSAVYTAPPRHSFIAALKDIPEIWEISYEDEPREGFGSQWVHDHRGDSGDKGKPVRFPIRKLRLSDYMDDFFFDQHYRVVMGTARDNKKGRVVDLDTGHEIAKLDFTGFPHLGSGITWNYHGHPVMASTNIKEGVVTVIDMTTYKTVKHIKTLGPGFFIRSHKNTPYAWVDVFFGPNRDAMQVFDKQTLKIVKTLRPAPGKTSAHVEFTKDGRYALVSIWDMDGAIVVYDAKTLKEVKRIPMKKPSGKYNVYNKTHYASGTSH
jgi:DNA-binding beta-propeller fold protein YncE/cytochrome c553